MNTKLISIIGVILAVVVSVCGLVYIFRDNGGLVGSTAITYSGSVGRAETYAIFSSLLTYITAVRAPLAGILTGSATLNATALGPIATATSSATTSITVTGAAAGDYVMLGSSTSTADVFLTGLVTAANTVSVSARNVNAAAQTTATTTLYAVVMPRASFTAPAALGTVSTSTP